MGSEVPILEFSTGPLVGRGSWPVGAGTHLPCPTLRTSQGPGGRPVTQCPSPLGLRRVRSIIMLQEKAQDRERLLLKFIKIMKVTWGLIQRGDPPPIRALPHSRLPLPAALTEAEQLQLLPGHPLGTGLGPHPQAGVAEADLRGGWVLPSLQSLGPVGAGGSAWVARPTELCPGPASPGAAAGGRVRRGGPVTRLDLLSGGVLPGEGRAAEQT